MYFVGDYANYYDPELSQALVAILRHHDIPVIVPRGQTSSGMAMISAGDLDAAREVAQTNLRVLGDYAREGIPILCTEPSAALCLKQEYPALLNHPDVQTGGRSNHRSRACSSKTCTGKAGSKRIFLRWPSMPAITRPAI